MHEEEAQIKKNATGEWVKGRWIDRNNKERLVLKTETDYDCQRCGKTIPKGSRALEQAQRKLPNEWVISYWHINEDCNNQPQGEAKPQPEAAKQIDLFEKEENKT